jgi:hypothetical protein
MSSDGMETSDQPGTEPKKNIICSNIASTFRRVKTHILDQLSHSPKNSGFLKKGYLKKEVTYILGLFKIFDEIIVDAADNRQGHPLMKILKVNINLEEGLSSLWNDGQEFQLKFSMTNLIMLIIGYQNSFSVIP